MSNTGEATTTARDQQDQENQTSTTEQQTGNDPTAMAEQAAEGNQAFTGENNPQASNNDTGVSGPKPDVSDQGYQELLPKLLNYFNNKREELARALGLHRSTVDRWLNGKSRPNNSTILRMRRLAQERRIE